MRLRTQGCASLASALAVQERALTESRTATEGVGHAARRSPRGALKRAHELLRSFSDPTRLRILHLLLGGETCVGDLEAVLGLPQSTTSRHLAYLRRNRLVATRQSGHWVFYTLAPPGSALHETLLGCLSSRLGGATELERDLRRLARKRARGVCCEASAVRSQRAARRLAAR